MKKITITLIILFVCMLLTATEQSLEQASKVAENFINCHMTMRQIVNQTSHRGSEGENFYLFQTNPVGFVVIPGDDIFPPIMAYSKHNDISGSDNPFIKMINTDLANRRRYYSLHPEESLDNQRAWDNSKVEIKKNRDFEQWPPEGSTSTDGWVETTWNQSGVYQHFCPMDNSGERSVVGCTATAMSMIMDFHKWIGDPTFSDSDDYYTWNEGMHIDNDHEERDFPSFPELNVYLDDVVDHYANGVPLTNDDKSALCFAAGVSVEMDYSSSGSGAWGVAWPLLNKFGYDTAIEVEGYEWNFYDIVIDNMKHMRPGELAIYSETSGHAIIVDGYNSDDLYHLNYGWGSSNNTCWYSLPNGMPSGYTVVSSCILNIEGGDVPIEVTGNIAAAGISSEGAEINLYGEQYSYRALVGDDGNFELPAVLEGYYTIEAILENRIYYYYEENVLIDEDNDEILIMLGNFEAVTGNVSAPVTVENSEIRLYQDNDLAYQGITDSNGTFSIPDVLPGNYRATASLAGNYYQENQIEITLENQTVSFDLDQYPGELVQSHGSSTVGIWSLIPGFTLGCAIKLTPDELAGNEDEIISMVRFKAPFNSDTGWIKAQIWEDDMLIGEKAIDDFTQGQWILCDLGNYIKVTPEKNYYVGYEAYSESGEFAWHDNQPRVLGKGAYINHSGWVELQPNNFNFNFCIEAILGSQEYGIITGSVDVFYSVREYDDIIVKAGMYTTHPDADGYFELPVKYGTYDIQAFYDGEESEMINDITVSSDLPQTDAGELEINIFSAADDDIPQVEKFINSYPNPFSYNSNSRSQNVIFRFNTGEDNIENETVEIYNIRGQKVQKLIAQGNDDNGNYTISWNGLDKNGKRLPTGIYFSKVKDRSLKPSKMIIIK